MSNNAFFVERKFIAHYRNPSQEEMDHMTAYTYNMQIPIGDVNLTNEPIKVQVDRFIRANIKIVEESIGKIKARYDSEKIEKDFELVKSDSITTFYINDMRKENEEIILHDTYSEI